ncbi:hypothetical protein LCGC14_1127450 [marine sediment metagenome]|uniref:SpoVT-AbrB domain-containing protein n=1 Tax=marine sediment metagenome TaxID=412755 RepID=A0A0F9M6Y0_9ZZZZ
MNDPSFTQWLQTRLEDISASKVTIEDAQHFYDAITKEIKALDMARKGLTSEFVTVDDRGRFVIPRNFRTILNITKDTQLSCHLNNPKNPRGLIIIKEN